jgi:DNA-binding GntR family transcriptional regulator
VSGATGKPRGRPKQSSEISLDDCRELDRDSDAPLYYQLGATLLEALETGPWREGARFATERELEERFRISQVVVRRALGLLEGDGAIVRRRGAGAFVAPRRKKTAIFGLIEALALRQGEVDVKIYGVREMAPDAAVARFLELDAAQARVCHVTAVFEMEGKPIGLMDSHTPMSSVPWLLGAAESLSSAGGYPEPPRDFSLTRAEIVFEHTFFGNWGGPKLGANAGDPALMTRLIQFGTTPQQDREGPLEFARIFFPARTTQILFTLES